MVKNFVTDRIETRNTSNPVKNSYIDWCCYQVLEKIMPKVLTTTRVHVPSVIGLCTVII